VLWRPSLCVAGAPDSNEGETAGREAHSSSNSAEKHSSHMHIALSRTSPVQARILSTVIASGSHRRFRPGLEQEVGFTTFASNKTKISLPPLIG
jgi:hypothetical protein